MAKRLRVLGEYSNGPRNLNFRAGQEFDAGDELFLFLTADAPDTFEIVEPVEPPKPKAKEVDKPPVNKMVDKPEKSK